MDVVRNVYFRSYAADYSAKSAIVRKLHNGFEYGRKGES